MAESILNSYTKEQLQAIVNNSINISEALRNAGYQYTGGTNHILFKKVCKEKGIDYSHFTGRGKTEVNRNENNVFCQNSTAAQATLRKWYLKGKYTPYKCAICGIDTWNNQPLTLRLDHINGHNHDNRLQNLRWVCPNCDSQLDTFCKGHQGLSQKQKILICPKCGKQISYGAKMCKECAAKEKHVVQHPNRETLKSLIRIKPFTEIAKTYKVSDKAIAKWCIAEGLPHRKKDIKVFSDQEWKKV